MKLNLFRLTLGTTFAIGMTPLLPAAEKTPDFSPRPDEQQLLRAMHSKMKERPRITVGQSHADIVGSDNRALQAAVDYIAIPPAGNLVLSPPPAEPAALGGLHNR